MAGSVPYIDVLVPCIRLAFISTAVLVTVTVDIDELTGCPVKLQMPLSVTLYEPAAIFGIV
jgi:hypothetical protein